MKILLLDSNPITAKLCKIALKKSGHQVTWAKSGQAAVDAADTETPDIVVAELNLPRHNGVEFLYEFRSQADWHHIPIIVYSEVSVAEINVSKSAWKNLNIREYFYKFETTPEKLVEAVNKITPVNV